MWSITDGHEFISFHAALPLSSVATKRQTVKTEHNYWQPVTLMQLRVRHFKTLETCTDKTVVQSLDHFQGLLVQTQASPQEWGRFESCDDSRSVTAQLLLLLLESVTQIYNHNSPQGKDVEHGNQALKLALAPEPLLSTSSNLLICF